MQRVTWSGLITLAVISYFGIERPTALVAADDVKIVKLTVQTTHDDKDDALSWLIEISDDDNVYGSVEVGSGEVWANDTAKDISINLKKNFAYADRKSVKIKVTQKSSGKNYGWEGYLVVNGVLSDNTTKKLINKTREFKLGENNNPKEAEFSFE
jgi:hypothetical protein